jgi:ribosomal RNA-processing protein 7
MIGWIDRSKQGHTMTPKAPHLLKGYLAVKVTFDSPDDVTFFYVKQHFGDSKKNTLFVANAPFYPNISTSILLKSLLGRFGRITSTVVIPNPRSDKNESKEEWMGQHYPSFLVPKLNQGKFAHVTFESTKEMKQALERLEQEMADHGSLIVEMLELITLQEETHRQLFNQAGKDAPEDHHESTPSKHCNILAVARRYRDSIQRISRQHLMEECNRVMEDYEEKEEVAAAARAEPTTDGDGFTLVTYSSTPAKRELQEDVTTTSTSRRNKGSKRSRKKRDSTGASELPDFYRFQQRETRQKAVHDLRKKFEHDLERVKRLKEERLYRPFS